MKIDIFAHVLPNKYKEALQKKSKRGFYLENLYEACPALFDVNIRMRAMDKYENYMQVLTLMSPPVESLVTSEDAIELTKIANDEMAELVTKYPDKFIAAVASLPMTEIDAAMKEADRAITELRFRGIQIYSSINGRPLDSPEFMSLYEKMTYYNLPIWIHPVRENSVPDYPCEDSSKYDINSLFGWPFESTATMTRLVYSGIFEKYPDLKIIIHHGGAMIPYFAHRIDMWEGISEMRLHNKYEHHLKRRTLDYYHLFYCDTALYGNLAALMCCHSFFGAENILFGTDAPLDNQNSCRVLRETILSVEEMNIPDSEKKKIFSENAKNLLRLPI